MTEPGNVLLDRAQLERAFTALGERLERRGVVADVFVVGGAAMALAYDATRVTRDVDSLFVPHGIVLEEARNVAESPGDAPVVAQRAGKRLHLRQGRSGQAPRVRPSRVAGDGGFPAPHLRNEGVRRQNPGYR